MASPAIFKGTKTQLLTQEGIKLKNGADKDILVGTIDPTATAVSADAGSLYMRDGTDEVYRKLSDGSNTDWKLLAGEGPKDIFYTEDFESFDIANITTGNNAVFLGAGAATATPVLEVVTPMAGKKSLKYTQLAGSLNDYFVLPAKTIDLKQASNEIGATFYFEYSGNKDDLKVVVYDVTNTKIISSDLDLLPVAGSPTRFSTSVPVLAGVTQLRFGIHVLVENISAVLEIDDIEFSTNPFVYKNLIDTQSFSLSLSGGGLTTITGPIRWGASLVETGSSILSYNDADGKFTVNRKCTVGISASLEPTGGGSSYILKNGTTATNTNQIGHTGQATNIAETMSGDVELNAGDYFVITTTATLSSATQSMNVVATATAPHVVTPAKSNLTDWAVYVPSALQGLTLSSSTLEWRRDGPDLLIRGRVVLSATTADEARIELPNSYVIKSSLVGNNNVGTYGRDSTSTNTHGGFVLATGTQTYFKLGQGTTFGSASVNPMGSTSGANSIGVATAYLEMRIPIEGWSSNATFLAAIPSRKVVNLNPTATSAMYTVAASTAYKKLQIDNITGSAGMVSLSASQLLMKKGAYTLDIVVGSRGNCDLQTIGIYNTTTASYIKERVVALNTNSPTEFTTFIYYFELTADATIEIRSKVGNGAGTFEYFSGGTLTGSITNKY